MTTSLLLRCNGTNGSTSFPDEGDIGHTITAYNGGQVSTSNPKYGTGALQMGSSSAHVRAPDHADWDFGANDFCIECWINTTSSSRGAIVCRGYNLANSVNGTWWVEMRVTGSLGYIFVGHYGGLSGSILQETVHTKVNDGVWHHIAYTRAGSTARLFIDGTQCCTNTATTVSVDLGNEIGIGYWSLIGGLVGQMDNIRITNGDAVYTSNFTPSNIGNFFTTSLQYKNAGGSFVAVTSELGATGSGIGEGSNIAYWDDPGQDRVDVEISDAQIKVNCEPDPSNSSEFELEVASAAQLIAADGTGGIGDVKVDYVLTKLIGTQLLLHMDGSDGSTSFPDDSSSAHTVTAIGNAQVDTAQKKFGTGAGLFDGTGDALTVPASNDWAFGTGDFTVDLWYRPTVATGTQEYIGTGDNSASTSPSWVFLRQNAGYLRFIILGTSNQYAGGGWTGTPGTWYHLAATYEGTTLRVFVDGTLLGSNSSVTNPTNLNLTLYVGGKSNYVNGHIDEVRIVKGEALHDAGGATFPVPTAPY